MNADYDEWISRRLDQEAARGLGALTQVPKMATSDRLQTFRDELAAAFPPFETLVAGRPVTVREVAEEGVELTVLSATDRPAASACIIFLHGGGLMFGNRSFEGAALVDLAETHRLVVLAVEYRLAPEHPYPAALDDCMASIDWAVDHAKELGIDPTAIVVAGRSAGGHLAAAAALRARDEGRHRIRGQLLIYPMLDDRTVPPAFDGETPVWNSRNNADVWAAYLGGSSNTRYGVPARAESFRGLPPAYLEVGSADLFAQESIDYASAILQAGGRAELHVWDGGYHGFDHVARDSVVGSAALAARAAWLERVVPRAD